MKDRFMHERLNVEGSKHPNFIGCWILKNPAVCYDLIEFFEGNKGSHVSGKTTSGEYNEIVKKTTDLLVAPRDLEKKKFGAVSTYIEQLWQCYRDYLEQWSFFKFGMPDMHIGRFNIQKYDEGGHFTLHSERTSLSVMHRSLVWMTYLNDMADGGETEFPMFGLKIKPEIGKTLIWPAEWTHAHLGAVVKKGSKYIITGWMYFPDDV